MGISGERPLNPGLRYSNPSVQAADDVIFDHAIESDAYRALESSRLMRLRCSVRKGASQFSTNPVWVVGKPIQLIAQALERNAVRLVVHANHGVVLPFTHVKDPLVNHLFCFRIRDNPNDFLLKGDARTRARFGLYYTHESGHGGGLRYFKERFGMRPARVSWLFG